MSKTHKEHKEGYIDDQHEFFNKLITHDWDTYQNSFWDMTRQFEVHHILKGLNTKPRRVLDVGCGCGYHDLLFAQYPGIECVVGIDYSGNSIEKANHHYPHPKIKRFHADLFKDNELIKRSGPFDLVTSFQVIEHLTNPQEFINACAELTIQSGYVAIVTPNRLRLRNRLLTFFGYKNALQDPLHFAEYTSNELIQMGLKAKLTCVNNFGRNFSFPVDLHRILPFTTELGFWMPSIADITGVVFQKKE